MIRSAAHVEWEARVEILRREQARLDVKPWALLDEQMALTARSITRFVDYYHGRLAA